MICYLKSNVVIFVVSFLLTTAIPVCLGASWEKYMQKPKDTQKSIQNNLDKYRNVNQLKIAWKPPAQKQPINIQEQLNKYRNINQPTKVYKASPPPPKRPPNINQQLQQNRFVPKPTVKPKALTDQQRREQFQKQMEEYAKKMRVPKIQPATKTKINVQPAKNIPVQKKLDVKKPTVIVKPPPNNTNAKKVAGNLGNTIGAMLGLYPKAKEIANYFGDITKTILAMKPEIKLEPKKKNEPGKDFMDYLNQIKDQGMNLALQAGQWMHKNDPAKSSKSVKKQSAKPIKPDRDFADYMGMTGKKVVELYKKAGDKTVEMNKEANKWIKDNPNSAKTLFTEIEKYRTAIKVEPYKEGFADKFAKYGGYGIKAIDISLGKMKDVAEKSGAGVAAHGVVAGYEVLKGAGSSASQATIDYDKLAEAGKIDPKKVSKTMFVMKQLYAGAVDGGQNYIAGEAGFRSTGKFTGELTGVAKEVTEQVVGDLATKGFKAVGQDIVGTAGEKKPKEDHGVSSFGQALFAAAKDKNSAVSKDSKKPTAPQKSSSKVLNGQLVMSDSRGRSAMQTAHYCYSTGQYSKAITFFSKEIAVNPDNKAALIFRAHSYSKTGDDVNALKDIERYKNAGGVFDDHSYKVVAERVSAEDRAKIRAESNKNAPKKVVKSTHGISKVCLNYYKKGLTCLAKKQYQEAGNYFTQASGASSGKRHPESFNKKVMDMRSHAYRKDPSYVSKAKKELELLGVTVSLDEEEVLVVAQKEAEEVLEAQNVAQRQKIAAKKAVGEAADKRTTEETAAKKFRIKGVKDRGINSSIYSTQGQIKYKQKKYTQAILCATKALQLDPSNSTALLIRSRCYKAQGDYINALKDLDAYKNFEGKITSDYQEVAAKVGDDCIYALKDLDSDKSIGGKIALQEEKEPAVKVVEEDIKEVKPAAQRKTKDNEMVVSILNEASKKWAVKAPKKTVQKSEQKTIDAKRKAQNKPTVISKKKNINPQLSKAQALALAKNLIRRWSVSPKKSTPKPVVKQKPEVHKIEVVQKPQSAPPKNVAHAIEQIAALEEINLSGDNKGMLKSYRYATKDGDDVLGITRSEIEYVKDDESGKMVATGYIETVKDSDGRDYKTIEKVGIEYDKNGKEKSYQQIVSIKDGKTGEETKVLTVVKDGTVEAEATTKLDKNGNEINASSGNDVKCKEALVALRGQNNTVRVIKRAGGSSKSAREMAWKRFKKGMATLKKDFAKIDASLRAQKRKYDKVVDKSHAQSITQMQNAASVKGMDKRKGERREKQRKIK
ncbi:MAG: hypothetical protein P9M13_10650 [Candidatus Ancaeobacter aquaticus]|nr:hypothetical protein [Candidatus Ancaeobacter aquaticus]